MKIVRTIVCKLNPSREQAAEMEATLVAFAASCNHIAEVCRSIHSTHKVMVQQECYTSVRAEYGLSANLTIRAIARVCVALKSSENTPSLFRPTSIDYDARIFSFRERDWTFSLTLLHSRQRLATVLGEHQQAALKGRKPTSATLVKRRDGTYFLHVQVKEEAPQPRTAADYLGVDLGIAQIAVDSDGNTYSGEPVERIRCKHNRQRRRLQRRNTKGAKKKLKRLAGKEARFRRHENHVISKRLLETAKRTGRGIAVEKLAGIRERIRARSGEARNQLSGWSFHQLRSFIEYKAVQAGIPVVAVNPRNTSRTCSQCGHCGKKNRKTQETFACQHCGFSCHADWNAARNIRSLAQAVCNPASELVGDLPSRKAAGLQSGQIVTGDVL